jgi:hypothetical protein
MEKMQRSLSAKGDTAGAIRYPLSHWRALTRYVDDGLLEVDNSSAERALRAVSIGREKYLFFGADSGGVRTASFYTLIGTAKLSGVKKWKPVRAYHFSTPPTAAFVPLSIDRVETNTADHEYLHNARTPEWICTQLRWLYLVFMICFRFKMKD